MDRVRVLRVLLTLIPVYYSCFCFGQNTTSQGKEFWTAYMSHVEDNGPSEMVLYVTADENTTVTLEVTDNSFTPISKNVTAGQVTIINVPKTAFLKNAGQYNKGLHITSTKNIAVFAHIYASSVSGATLLLPVSVLGKSYYSINYTQQSNSLDAPNGGMPSYSTFMVVATEDNTTVEITPSQQLTDAKPAGQTFSIALMKGEVYQGMSVNDLTNTRIRSVSNVSGLCKKIAVFSGSTKIGIGCRDKNFTSDNLFQQVYPTTAWGKNYITVPLKNRNYDIFRVFVTDPYTVLNINGQVIDKANYSSQHYYEFESDKANTIVADKPVQVVQYAVSQGKVMGNGCQFNQGDQGDPEMIYLSPLEQTLDHVTLYSSISYQILHQYINVIIKSDAASSFRIDGAPYSDFKAVPGMPGYTYAQISVGAGTHTLNAAEGFGAIAYGFGNYESYGYAAGTNLKNLNEYLVLTNPEGTTTQYNGCAGVNYKLLLHLPFKPTKIVWDFKDGSTPYVETDPIEKEVTTNNGQTIYSYQYKKDVSFTAGNYNITATATNASPAAEECGTDVNVDFDFHISNIAAAQFSVDSHLCSASPVIINDESNIPADEVTRIRIWYDYANHPELFNVYEKGELPEDRKYQHQYPVTSNQVNYTIRMEVFSGENAICSNAVEHVVTVKGSPVVSVSPIGALCQNDSPVQLLADNHGYIGNGTFSGTGVNASGKFDPTVSGAGTFTITYNFIAQNGCDTSYNTDITVNPLPVITSGKYMQLLEGESKQLPVQADTTRATYKWEPETGLNDPDIINPVCSATDDITYKLTVTSAAGCILKDELFVKVLKKPVVVNAFSPNGDGINDTWTIKYLDTYPGSTVDIYNRQGEKVYSSLNYAVPWDGRYKGALLPSGTYYYIINPKNGRKIIAGNVTIIR